MGKGRDQINQFILYSSTNNSRKTLTKITSAFMILTVTLLITSSITINDAFANHLSNDLKWQLVYISSHPACSNYDYQMMSTYFGITTKYLDLYELQNSNYDPLCIPDEKYKEEYQSPTDLDLIVLVYDNNLGENELHANKIGGLYAHSGIDRTHNHAIIICDCSTFYYSNPVWILSHELSHFILYYKDYKMQVIEDVIHASDKKYDQCLESYNVGCAKTVIKLSAGPAGYDYSVMPVYKPALKYSGTSSTNDNQTPEVVLGLGKMITKWWASGKITDGDYANAVGYVSDSNVLSSHKEIEIVLKDDPLDDEKTWSELMDEITPEYWDRPAKSDDPTLDILSRVPKNLVSQNDKVFSEEVAMGLPNWFKQTAEWWAQDKITDKEFKKNVEYLIKSGIVKSSTSNIIPGLAIEEEILDPSTLLIELVNDIESFVDSGDLGKNRGDILITELNTAKTKFDNNKINNACKKIDGFTDQLQKFVDNNKFEKTKGDSLISSAENLKQTFC